MQMPKFFYNLKENSPFRISLVAATILILELTFIRQLPAENHSLSYFSNLILMSSFFGLGLGCILSKKPQYTFLLPFGVVGVYVFLLLTRGMVVYEEASVVHFWLQPPAGAEGKIRLPILISVVWAFIVALLPFITLGQALAQEMDKHPRLVAYSWDIAGSLGGTIIFALSSYFLLPPWIWPAILMIVYGFIFVSQKNKTVLLIYILSGILFLDFSNTAYNARWSPYYLVQHFKNPLGISVWVNSSFHQEALNFTSTDPEYKDKAEFMLGKFSSPYVVYREHNEGRNPESVLVLGAGTGNDVNVALANGVKKVTAIEIDPVILDLGRKENPHRPYSDERVTLVLDDARHFLEATKEKFDLIVFGTLDSQTLLSGVANLRLENYVYTVESLTKARDLLKEGGMVALYYSVFKPWLYGRIYTTIRAAFGDQSKILFSEDPFLFNTLIIAAKDIPTLKDSNENVTRFGNDIPSVDNWPFLYIERPTIAPIYQKLFIFLVLLILLSFFILKRTHASSSLHLNFLFMGVGFTLMESAAIVRLALLFGSTWVVNVIVFSAVLIMIFLANLLVLKD